MKYDRLIIEILIEAGSDGLTVRKVSRHVFNAVNGLFDEADIEAVHKLVERALRLDGIKESLPCCLLRLPCLQPAPAKRPGHRKKLNWARNI